MTTDLDVPQVPLHHPVDWRLRLSMAITILWTTLGLIYITSVVGWVDFARLNAPSLGGFLEGAFAPLAFLWLVVGFFMQQSQLSQNTHAVERQLEVMRQAALQAELQSRAIAADELHSRQDTYLRVADLVNEQLGVVAGLITTSWEADAYPPDAERPSIKLWDRLGAGDRNAFSLRILVLCFTEEVEARELFYGTEIRIQHTTNFRRSFERLLARAKTCDSEGMIEAALRDSQNGRVYRFMVQADPDGTFA